ncbi:uncharacterized protein LOC111088729 [Limulus polyphemus]|uniref:Uncharacterized protein LOC111088729 n=1 Tax=Limulus polyphemus TaxID=6850 RepID=A0ABM1THE3_LIMPO|nr:uncharacterized protein LOC111088729 [Limulus polyphemus]
MFRFYSVIKLVDTANDTTQSTSQSLSGASDCEACEADTIELYFCADNTDYMQTGLLEPQTASSTDNPVLPGPSSSHCTTPVMDSLEICHGISVVTEPCIYIGNLLTPTKSVDEK